jgi:hypothetical protein
MFLISKGRNRDSTRKERNREWREIKNKLNKWGQERQII